MGKASKDSEFELAIERIFSTGKPSTLETVDFGNPDRAKTCLEVDFPILQINQLARIEGNSGKPLYQMSKWWARRRPSVFRAMLLASCMKAPRDEANAAKGVWAGFYRNYQSGGSLGHVKVLDLFMGGGTTLVEASRLGMQATGLDLNPVAWFVVKQEFARVSQSQLKEFFASLENSVRKEIIQFYACRGPHGESGIWTHKGKKTTDTFDPFHVCRQERNVLSYDGPESIYTFWVKHGPCMATGCGHRTPLVTSPVLATKTLTVKYWSTVCSKCKFEFDVEDCEARMAPDEPLVVAEGERAYSVLDRRHGAKCPNCGHLELVNLGKGESKKIDLSLLAHPDWLKGLARFDDQGREYGGSDSDNLEATTRWLNARASKAGLIEVRGTLADELACPGDGSVLKTGAGGGTIPRSGEFTCAACGKTQKIVLAIEASGKTAPVAPIAIQGYSKLLEASNSAYGGRFFIRADDTTAFVRAFQEWDERKAKDLSGYWPTSDIPFGHMTHQRQPLPAHGYHRWSQMFNARQLIVLATILRKIVSESAISEEVREAALGAFQQYLRNQNMFCFWDRGYDKLVPHMSNNNFHPKNMPIENSVFSLLGRGNWTSCAEGVAEGLEFADRPWDTVSMEEFRRIAPQANRLPKGKSGKAYPGDRVTNATIQTGSATKLSAYSSELFDLVVTDPPFGGLLHYSELADFFYVWLRLALKDRYPEQFTNEYVPKTLEIVANKARQPDDPDAYYKRLLTEAWREARRVLKPGGILTFTFHHSEDEPWVAVLESLFEAGFYLEATYPIRSDETKGEGEFGSKTIEYDIIHVCRKRTGEPTEISWPRLRRRVLSDVEQIEVMLTSHAQNGLPSADLQVIRRGKALEHFSRHYGKVMMTDGGEPMSVAAALVGINQLIDEETDVASDVPPMNAEPITRQFLRMFRGKASVHREQIQKFLKGTGVAPEEFESRGWAVEKQKYLSVIQATDFAAAWRGRQRRSLKSDYDQAWYLIGACHDGSGINAAEQLRNEHFDPHVALKPLLEWFSRNGTDVGVRQAAIRALTIYNGWADSHSSVVEKQLELFN